MDLDKFNYKLDQILALQTNALNVKSLSIITGWSISDIYKKTSSGLLPYYKPNGKTIFFKKNEIEGFLLSNRSSSTAELEDQAINYVTLKTKRNDK